MNNFKAGDRVDWVTDFNDNGQFEWPGVVIGTYQCTAGTVAQFYIRKKGDTKGRMRIKEWLVCHLKPHQPKPRCKLVPVNTLKPGDKVWSVVSGSWHDIGILSFAIAQKPEALWEGSKYVWKQTALQADAGAESGRGHANPMPFREWGTHNISRIECDPRLDEGAGGAYVVPREGNCGTADPVQSPAQPRATVRMTRGRDIKPGERVSFIVAQDDPAGLYYNVGNVAHMINPAFFYMVVNNVTK